MALYFVFPFIFYAIALIVKQSKGKLAIILGRILLMVAVFIATNLVILLPFLMSSGVPGVK
jgi:hypothetical protein